ncbi:MAG TPA: glycosyltransferase family 2 protein [Verrucomicrobiae bacterium]|nr:glycosyltransferase family 2 protein [Verrucomicrobiae bacterium]
MIDVSVIIVTYNSEKQIVACLESVFAQCQNITQEVIVLDNSPADGTAKIVQNRFPQVKLILPGKNLGFAAGVNEACRHATGEFVLLLNPDTIILRNAIGVVVEFARANPSYGIYGGRTLKEDGSLERSSCWGLPSLWSLATFAVGLSAIAPRSAFFHPEGLGQWKRDTVREVGVITGCFLLAPLTVWRKLNGLDERFFMYGEDTDLAMRARKSGFRPVICPAAELVHEVGQSSSTPLHKALLLYRGKACYVRTHWSGIRQQAGLWMLQLGVGLRSLAAAMLRKPDSTWCALWKKRGEWLAGYPAFAPEARTPRLAPKPVR